MGNPAPSFEAAELVFFGPEVSLELNPLPDRADWRVQRKGWRG